MNGYQPTSQFEQYVVDELLHIKNHMTDMEKDVKGLSGFPDRLVAVESDVKVLNGFANRVRGQSSVLGAVFGTVSAWLLTIFKGHQ